MGTTKGELMDVNRRRNSVRMLGVVAIAGLVVAACGSSSKTGSTTTAAVSTTASTTQAPTTTAFVEPSFKVDTSKCPADATTKLAAGDPIKIAFIGPQTGPLAGFGVIKDGMQAYFDKINTEEGGVDGHKLQVVAKDDEYDPAKSAPAVQEAIEKDKVFASAFQIGSANVAATRPAHEKACVPQVFVGTGLPNWGDPQNHNWTVGGILAYNTEAKIWAEYLKKHYPNGVKVGELVYNNAFGKSYQAQFAKEIAGTNIKIVASKLHDGTSNLTNEVTALNAAGPEVILGETTSTFCTNLIKLSREGGFEGPIILSATCASVTQFFAPAGDAAKNVFVLLTSKDVGDPTMATDPAVKDYTAVIKKYAPSLDPTVSNVGTGYVGAYFVVDALKRAAKFSTGLTRANFMNAVWSINLTNPLAIGGTVKLDPASDGYTAEWAEMVQFDPAKKTLTSTGDTFDFEGKTGLFAPKAAG
jgi:branched-chain amino acid transport system substrate-binding protein